ncbi:MAG: homoserine dehydrogenase [Ruminococcaceae bacterium]|nr:homoserine dehydrogenase [Oscillospiraceae bacterium]
MKKYAAILGCGVVGSGAAELLTRNAGEIFRRTGAEVELKYILVRRDKESPYQDRFVKDFAVIEKDPDVSIVAECIGGVGDALDYCRRTLKAGKSLVTSNKELVAKHGLELAEIARAKGVSFLFEGAVGGGIPALRPIQLCLSANRVTEAMGVVNGTTNYILTAMEKSGAAFADALATAQQLGYAEQDPSADILGWDAGRKAAILAGLSFGTFVDVNKVPMEGITSIDIADMQAAKALNRRIKLIGRAVRVGDGVSVCCAPHLLPVTSPLSALEGVLNGVLIRGDGVGEVFLSGPGAGSLATGSAVAGDIVDAALTVRAPHWAKAKKFVDPDEIKSRWYVRCKADEAAIRAALPGAECPLDHEGVFLTGELTRKALNAIIEPLQPINVFRLLD